MWRDTLDRICDEKWWSDFHTRDLRQQVQRGREECPGVNDGLTEWTVGLAVLEWNFRMLGRIRRCFHKLDNAAGMRGMNVHLGNEGLHSKGE